MHSVPLINYHIISLLHTTPPTLFPYTTLFRSLGKFHDPGLVKHADQRAPHRHGFLHIEKSTTRSEEHTSELQSLTNIVCRLLLEKKNTIRKHIISEIPTTPHTTLIVAQMT